MTMTPQRPVKLVLSVDVPPSLEADDERLDRLAHALAHPGSAVTWALDEPGSRTTANRLRRRVPNSEFSILADAGWVGPRAGRTRFAHQLSRWMLASRRAGLTVSTITLQDTSLHQHLDLLVKHRICWVRAHRVDPRAGSPLRPENLRYGVWQLTPTVSVPGPHRWMTALALRQQIRRFQLVHLRVDGERVAASSRDLSWLDTTIRHLAQRSARGQLTMMTHQALARCLFPTRRTRGMHSILHRAA